MIPPAESKHSRTGFAKSDDQPWETASVHIDPVASIQLNVARKAASSSAMVVGLGLFDRPKSDRCRCNTIAGHRTPNTDKKQFLSLNRARMMQYHQILKNKRKSDQPEETTVNELRVDDIAMDQGGRLRLMQYASVTSMR